MSWLRKNYFMVGAITVIVVGITVASVYFKSVPKGEDNAAIAVAPDNGSYMPLPSIGTDADYGADFETYKSDLGFSFKYPPHMYVMVDPDVPRLYVVSKSYKTDGSTPFAAIVISAGDNNENMTPEEWLLGPTSGYDKSENYYKTDIDGQSAVYTDGGMWAVVNTPDNKWRLSIAYTVDESADIPFTEMGVIIESLTFDK